MLPNFASGMPAAISSASSIFAALMRIKPPNCSLVSAKGPSALTLFQRELEWCGLCGPAGAPRQRCNYLGRQVAYRRPWSRGRAGFFRSARARPSLGARSKPGIKISSLFSLKVRLDLRPRNPVVWRGTISTFAPTDKRKSLDIILRWEQISRGKRLHQ
jgi:hypothetical protein